MSVRITGCTPSVQVSLREETVGGLAEREELS